MNQFGKELKTYAENGLRTPEAWLTLGRQVTVGLPPRVNIDSRGKMIELFSKDQTARSVRDPQPQ